MRTIHDGYSEHDRGMDLIVSLIMSASVKVCPTLSGADLGLEEDAVMLLADSDEVSIHEQVEAARLRAALVMGKLAELDPHDVFLTACLMSLVLKAYDDGVTRSFRTAVAGLVKYLAETSDTRASCLMKSAMDIALLCNKKNVLSN